MNNIPNFQSEERGLHATEERQPYVYHALFCFSEAYLLIALYVGYQLRVHRPHVARHLFSFASANASQPWRLELAC